MWRLLKLGYRHEPGLLVAAFSLSLLAAVPDALMALWLKLLGEGVLQRDRRLVLATALGLGATADGTWFLVIVSTRVQRRFRDKVTIALESHVARLQAEIATIAHQERPEYLDRLSVLRNQVFVLDHMYMSLFSTCGWILRLGVVVGLLMSIHPALALLAVFALPTVSPRPGGRRSSAPPRSGARPPSRLAQHLFTTATTAPPGKEVRVTRIGQRLVEDRRQAWERWYGPVAAARWSSARWHALAWTVFGAGLRRGHRLRLVGPRAPRRATCCSCWPRAARLSAYIGATVGEIGFLRGIWLDGSRRLAWLEDYAASLVASADQPAPAQLREGIRLEGVSFAYPGTERLVLDDVTSHCPRARWSRSSARTAPARPRWSSCSASCTSRRPGGSWSTARRSPGSAPTTGARAWPARSRTSSASSFRARHSVGLGDVPRLDDEPAVAAAVERAGADDVVARLPAGLDTQLGPTWPGGVEVSFGQWQKLALARGFMRDEPLLLVLDEPTAALDAETEHALFERYAAAARGRTASRADAAGGITILVSHRFSTVRMADLIVVLDGARLVEVGTHEDLMAKGGHYAELYGIQAAAYR